MRVLRWSDEEVHGVQLGGVGRVDGEEEVAEVLGEGERGGEGELVGL